MGELQAVVYGEKKGGVGGTASVCTMVVLKRIGSPSVVAMNSDPDHGAGGDWILE
jgi:hypothetical protein